MLIPQQPIQGSIDFERFDAHLGIEYSNYASEQLKKDYWVVKKDFIYYLDDTYTSYVHVPRGYLTDGASVPRIFWSVIPPWGKYGQACVLHDYLCEYNYYHDGLHTFNISRKQVNSIFNEAMKEAKVPTFKRHLINNAVELYRLTVNNGFEPKNPRKVVIEHQLVDHFISTGNWK